MRAVVAIGVVFVAAAGCLSQDPDHPATLEGPFATVPEGVLRFLVIGDSGTGEQPQYDVASTMFDVCVERGCQFVLGNGDNIYEDGPTAGADDPQFLSKFEEPYALFPDIPFYMVLGNHDNGDGLGSDSSVGDAEVEYAARTDRPSEKWQMPDRWYTWTELAGDVQFFALDSGPIETAYPPIFLPGMLGPQQADWLATAIADSTASWKFAFAHHPYISNGQHGDAGFYDGAPLQGLAWKGLLDDHVCGQVDVYFAGHDHDLQWLEPTSGCEGTEHIISGAAAKQRSRGGGDNPAYFEAYDTYGFFWIEVAGDTFTGVAFDSTGAVLYERSFRR